MGVKRLAILGSTGSIGRQTLEVVAAHPDRFHLVALTAHRGVSVLAQQAAAFRPDLLVVVDQDEAQRLAALLPADFTGRVLWGPQGYTEAAAHSGADVLVSAMVGAAGLGPSMAAVSQGIDIALANKETLVAAGQVFMNAAQKSGAAILPVDSEHSALFQALVGNDRRDVARLWLTASGGPFRDWPAEKSATANAAQALKHPNWTMGPKITIDSATLMNKGLEVIEARWLFDQPYDRIQVVVHPQSLVHSMVQYQDGSFLAHLGLPDMRVPIAYALGHPRRLELPFPAMDPWKMPSLEFHEPDTQRFPCLGLAYQAGRAGGTFPAALNAANEVAVEHFLQDVIPLGEIPHCVAEVLNRHQALPGQDLGEIFEADQWARRQAARWLASRR